MPRRRYVYRVKAINRQGLSQVSSYANAETPGIPPPPAAPRNLTADGVAPNRVELSWDDPQDSSITGYQILRRSRDGPEYGDGLGPHMFSVIVDDTGSAATNYIDTTAGPRTRYAYALKARSPYGLSQRSGPTCGDPCPTCRSHGARARLGIPGRCDPDLGRSRGRHHWELPGNSSPARRVGVWRRSGPSRFCRGR